MMGFRHVSKNLVGYKDKRISKMLTIFF